MLAVFFFPPFRNRFVSLQFSIIIIRHLLRISSQQIHRWTFCLFLYGNSGHFIMSLSTSIPEDLLSEWHVFDTMTSGTWNVHWILRCEQRMYSCRYQWYNFNIGTLNVDYIFIMLPRKEKKNKRNQCNSKFLWEKCKRRLVTFPFHVENQKPKIKGAKKNRMK